MVYQTGIKNRIRMFGKMNYMGDQETEGIMEIKNIL